MVYYIIEVINSKINVFLRPMIIFVFANCEDNDEMLHFAAFHPGIHYLLKHTHL